MLFNRIQCAATTLGVLCIGITSSPQALAEAGDIGARVLIQDWEPRSDQDEALRVLDDSSLISRSFHDRWAEGSSSLHETLKGFLAQGDLLAEGVTLSEIDLQIDPPSMAASRSGGGGDLPLLLDVNLAFKNVHLNAKSTTPSVLGSYADPRCSIAFDLAVSLPVEVGHSVASPLRMAPAPAGATDRTVSRISNVRLDSQNLSCDILLEVVSWLGLDDKLSSALADPDNPAASALNSTLIEQYQHALTQVNSMLSSLVPTGFAVSNAWATGQAQTLVTLAFTRSGPFPDSSPRATISGALLLQSTEPGMSGSASWPAYGTLPVVAARKAGPRRILTPAGDLGEEPLEILPDAIFAYAPSSGGYVYEFSGLSSGYTNYVDVGSDSGCTASNPAAIQRGIRVKLSDGRAFNIIRVHDLSESWALLATSFAEPCGSQVLPFDPPLLSEDWCPQCTIGFEPWREVIFHPVMVTPSVFTSIYGSQLFNGSLSTPQLQKQLIR